MYPKRARDLKAADLTALIRQLDFGPSMDDQSAADLARNSVVLDVRRRRFVYKAGDPADSLFAIVHGRVKLCRIDSLTEREAVIDILSEGSLFGESALYSTAGRRENCAITYANSRLIKIPARKPSSASKRCKGCKSWKVIMNDGFLLFTF